MAVNTPVRTAGQATVADLTPWERETQRLSLEGYRPERAPRPVGPLHLRRVEDGAQAARAEVAPRPRRDHRLRAAEAAAIAEGVQRARLSQHRELQRNLPRVAIEC